MHCGKQGGMMEYCIQGQFYRCQQSLAWLWSSLSHADT